MVKKAQVIILFVGMGMADMTRAEEVSFNRDVRPILSGKCFQCHGPDSHERKAGLRLDTKEGAFGERDGVSAIDAKDLAKSELLFRITTDDPDEKMPPVEGRHKLEADEIETLKKWVLSGGEYEDHWAFVPPRKWQVQGENAIDLFVSRAIAKRRLEKNPRAEKETLIRRVTFDLTGLPPTPVAVDAFLADNSAGAYEKVVDRLLDSRSYGERMALAWMDLARYGDSSVMHADGPRFMWPWRDWVIDAYNGNMPFDQFTVEQIAGDLLPDATTGQKVASGFNRNHATSDEGGAIPEELRVEYVVDRVKTTSNVWMALTMECSQCHDHKYDPISQREYYEMFAYFNNTTDPGMQTRNGNQAPTVRIIAEDRQKTIDDLKRKLEAATSERDNSKAPEDEVTVWAEGLRSEGSVGSLEVGGWSMLGAFKAKDAKQAFDKDFGPEKGVDLKKEHDGRKWAATESELNEDGKVHTLSSIPDNHASYFFRVIKTDQKRVVPASFGSDDGIKVWLNGKQIIARNEGRAPAPDQERTNFSLEVGDNKLLVKIINHSGPAGFYFKMGASGLPEDIRDLIAKGELDEAEQSKLREHYTTVFWPKRLDLDAKIADLDKQQKQAINSAPTSMIMQDNAKDKMRVTYILNRGQYDQPMKDKPVAPGVPSALPKLPSDAPSNRLGLARWLTDPKHPLTARVAVNRYWAMLFGEGLVRTVGDFGNQGEWPSHPALLDWLAVDFVESGWDVKRMLKQIVMSEAYRRSPRVAPKHQQLDPENRFLARGARFRLQGEFVRDNALSLSGLLVDKVGGASVKPYQPKNIWNEVSLNGGLRYKPDSGEGLYRRSMYTYWKRSAPMPNMLIFDAPTREKCVVQRARTNTPLQAFVTLNDPQFVEAARAFAQRLIKEGGENPEDRIDFAFRLAAARGATAREVVVLNRILAERLEAFSKDAVGAKKLVEVGESKRDESIGVAEHAAWTVVAQMILNLDEVLTRG